jgi:hypothetical protein
VGLWNGSFREGLAHKAHNLSLDLAEAFFFKYSHPMMSARSIGIGDHHDPFCGINRDNVSEPIGHHCGWKIGEPAMALVDREHGVDTDKGGA